MIMSTMERYCYSHRMVVDTVRRHDVGPVQRRLQAGLGKIPENERHHFLLALDFVRDTYGRVVYPPDIQASRQRRKEDR